MKARIRRENADEPVINITPLIDVVFVVLIAFIIIAPLLQKDDVELAKAGHVSTSIAAAAPTDLQIRVSRNDTIFIQGKVVKKEQVSSILGMLRARFPNKSPQVFFDVKSSFGTYHFLKDAFERAGFQEMEVVLAP